MEDMSEDTSVLGVIRKFLDQNDDKSKQVDELGAADDEHEIPNTTPILGPQQRSNKQLQFFPKTVYRGVLQMCAKSPPKKRAHLEHLRTFGASNNFFAHIWSIEKKWTKSTRDSFFLL